MLDRTSNTGTNWIACEEKRRLLSEYSRTAVVYAEAVSKLAHAVSGGSQAYMALQNIAEHTRRASADARKQLNRHISEHHC